MARSSKLLVAMQGKGVFVIDLAERSVVSGLHDCIVVAPGPDNGETFFAGTDKGQYKSIDGGRNWQLKGLEQYKIFSLAFHPSDPKTIYAGTEPALLFRSSDGGETWTELDGVRKLPGRSKWCYPAPPYIAHIKGIAIHPEDPEVMYCSIEEGGVIQSLDAGESWRYVSKGEAETFRPVSRVTGVYQDCHVVRISPHDPDSLFLTTGDGLYRSDDCGKSWRRIDRGYRMKKYFGSVVLHPARSESHLRDGLCRAAERREKRKLGLQEHGRRREFQRDRHRDSPALYRRMERSGDGPVGRRLALFWRGGRKAL